MAGSKFESIHQAPELPATAALQSLMMTAPTMAKSLEMKTNLFATTSLLDAVALQEDLGFPTIAWMEEGEDGDSFMTEEEEEEDDSSVDEDNSSSLLGYHHHQRRFSNGSSAGSTGGLQRSKGVAFSLNNLKLEESHYHHTSSCGLPRRHTAS